MRFFTLFALLILVAFIGFTQDLNMQAIRSDTYHGKAAFYQLFLSDALAYQEDLIICGTDAQAIILARINQDNTPVWIHHLNHDLLDIYSKQADNLTLMNDSAFLFSVNAVNLNGDSTMLVCMNIDGEIAWARKFFQESKILIHDIQITNNQEILCLAELYGSMEFLIMKLDQNGNNLWSKNINLNQWASLSPMKILSDEKGNIFVSGLMYQAEIHGFFIKIDENGTPVFQKTYDLNSNYGIDWFSFEKRNGGFQFLFYYDSKLATASADSLGFLADDLKVTGNEFYSSIKITDFQKINDTLYLAQNRLSDLTVFSGFSFVPGICIFNPEKDGYTGVWLSGDHCKTVTSDSFVFSSFVEGPIMVISKDDYPHVGIYKYTFTPNEPSLMDNCMQSYYHEFQETNSVFQNSDSSCTVINVACQEELFIEFEEIELTTDSGCVDFISIGHLDEATRYKIYPNPAREYVWIQGLTGGENLRLIDLTGKIVTEVQCNVEARITLSDRIKPGVYILQIQKDKMVSALRLLVE